MKNLKAGRGRFTTIAVLGLIAGLIAASSAAAVAQTAREACTSDAFRLCSAAMPDVARTKACLARNRSSLSPLCRTAFASAGTHARHHHHHHH
ncbi:MAG TPA: hypothetical protein VKP67_18560 [Xanthobacteraceae bacterium]|nr:hypothetical protein [Xanthobacteraceae bacterium]